MEQVPMAIQPLPQSLSLQARGEMPTPPSGFIHKIIRKENTLAGGPISYQEFWKKLGEFTAGKFQKFNAA